MTRDFLTSLLLAGVSATAVGTTAWAEDETPRVSELVVTSEEEAKLSPGVVSVVYPDAVKGEHKSLPDLLDQIPGVYARRVGGTGKYTTASIRGSAPTQVNIYIDGVPFNLASEAAADLSTIPISNVARVEVYRGTTPARFSGAPLGGAINIVTKAPSGIGGNASAGARSFGGAQFAGNVDMPLLGGGVLLGFDADKSEGNFKYDHFASVAANQIEYGDGVLRESGLSRAPWRTCLGNGTCSVLAISQLPTRRTRMNNEQLRYNFLAKWQGEDFSLKYSALYLDRTMPEPTYGAAHNIYSYTDIPDYSWPYNTLGRLGTSATPAYNAVNTNWNPGMRQRQVQHDVVAGWERAFGDLTVAANLNYLDQDKKFDGRSRNGVAGLGKLWSTYHTTRYGGSVDLTYDRRIGPTSHRFELHYDQTWEMLDADMSGLRNSVTGVIDPNTHFLAEFNRERQAVQFQDTIVVHPLGDLLVTPIVRMERMEGPVLGRDPNMFGRAEGDFGWKPSGGLSVKKTLLDDWLIFANGGTYNRYPNFYEIYGDGLFVSTGSSSVGGVTPLLRETGYNFDAGFGWNGDLPGDWRGSFRLTYFQRRADRAITYFATPAVARYMNTGSTLTKGGELEASLAWGDRADLQLAATRTEGYYAEGTYYMFAGHSVAERIPPSMKLETLQSPIYAGNARLNLHFMDGRLTAYLEGRHIGKNYISQNMRYAPLDRPSLAYEAPLTTVNLGAHLKLPYGVTLSAGVNDVFNRQPKQKFHSNEFHEFFWNECPALPVAERPACNATYEMMNRGEEGDPAYAPYFHRQVYYLPRNVYFPEQGRSYYVTLAKSFGGEGWSSFTGPPRGHHSWTGFYAAGHLGDGEQSNAPNALFVFDKNRDGNFVDRMLVGNNAGRDVFAIYGFDGRGAAQGLAPGDAFAYDDPGRDRGGVRVGYDRQFAGGFVAGVLAEHVDFGGGTDSVTGYSATLPAWPLQAHGAYVLTRTLESTLALRARAGFTWKNVLGYATGGYVQGDVDHGFSTTSTANSFTELGEERRLEGYQYGFGAEWRVSRHWSVGAEYLYTWLDDSKYMVRAGSNGSTPNANPFMNNSATGQTDIRRTDDTIVIPSLRATVALRF